jgi:hypothetical protein
VTDVPPELIALDPDDYHAKYVGRTADGRQFFITTHVDTRCAVHGHAFVAVYTFNAAGELLKAEIDDMGTYAAVDGGMWTRTVERRFHELGWTAPRRIVMAPFEVERFGIKFGLIAHRRDDGRWIAEVQPGNNMAFFAPWHSGVYDT